MPIELVGIPLGYFLLLGLITGTTIVPPATRQIESSYRKWRYHSMLISRYDSPNLFAVMLAYLWSMQHQIKNINTMLVTYEFGRKKFVFQLPFYNHDFEIQTKYTILIFRIVSGNGLTIDGIEVSVVQRCWKGLWFQREHKLNCLNWFIKQICSQGNLVPPVNAINATRPDVVCESEICKSYVSKEYMEELAYLQEQQKRLQLKADADNKEIVDDEIDTTASVNHVTKRRRRRINSKSPQFTLVANPDTNGGQNAQLLVDKKAE
jgi:hypothetical protein